MPKCLILILPVPEQNKEVSKKFMEKEVAVIGAGIAGVSAAIYLKRAGLSFSLFDKADVGGQLLLMEDVDNYPGIKTTCKGYELAQNLADNLKSLDIELERGEVSSLNLESNKVSLTTDKGNFLFSAAIIASGASPRRLGVEGEERLSGKGVSYCAICDGFFFRSKEVAVVGGGNTAVEEALYLADICKKVYLIHRRDKLRAIGYLQKKLFAKENIEILFNKVVKEIKGDEILESLILEDTQSKETSPLKIHGIFIAIGVTPNTGFLNNVIKLDEQGFIITDEFMQTSSSLIWAAGDCRRRPLRQLITAAGEGATAAISVYRFLRGQYISS